MKDQIIQIFGGCKNALCNCTAKESFEEHKATTFYVYDEVGGKSQQPVRVVGKDQSFQLTVNNPLNKTIVLGKLDKCLLDDAVIKCDCLLYGKEQLYFVEIKSSSPGTKANKRKKAVEQLKKTIQVFKNIGLPLDDYKIMALICFKSNEPRIPQASRNTASAFFLLEMGVRLEEGNSIDFI